MKFKQTEFHLDAIPSVSNGSIKLYSTSSAIDYFDYFNDLIGGYLHFKEFKSAAINIGPYISEEQIISCLNAYDDKIKARKEAEQREIENALAREKYLLNVFKDAFAVNIKEFNATFLVPFERSKLSKEYQELIGRGNVFPSHVIKQVLLEGVKYKDGIPFEPEYCIDRPTALWLMTELRNQEIQTVATALVSTPILENAKAYVLKTQTFVKE